MKCHSKRLDSRGAACKVGSGWAESSLASLRIRLMVGDLVLKVGRAMDAEDVAVVKDEFFGWVHSSALKCSKDNRCSERTSNYEVSV